MASQSLSVLKNFDSDVFRSRRAYLESLDKFPPITRDVIERHFKNRTKRAAPRYLLGEYAPWLIADMLGITTVPAVQRSVIGWLHIYFCVMLADDLLDLPPTEDHSKHIIVSLLMLQRGLCEILDSPGSSQQTREALDLAFSETAFAAIHELTAHRRRLTSFTSQELANTGQKLALLRVCANAIADLGSVGHNGRCWIDNVLIDFASGIQLLDDLNDWEEDYQSGQLTFPLTYAGEATSHFPQFGAPDYTSDRALLQLLRTGAIAHTLRAAIIAFDRSLHELNTQPARSGSTMHRYIAALKNDCEKVLAEVEHAQQGLCVEHGHNAADGALAPVEGEIEVVRKLRDTLLIVAQGS